MTPLSFMASIKFGLKKLADRWLLVSVNEMLVLQNWSNKNLLLSVLGVKKAKSGLF